MHPKDTTKTDLSETLRILRIDRYTQKELAGKLQVSQQAISRWERGTALPDFSNLVKISELYNVPLKELIEKVPATSAPPNWAKEYEVWENAHTPQSSGCTSTVSEISVSADNNTKTPDHKSNASESSDREETVDNTSASKKNWHDSFYFVATGLILFSSIYLFYVGFPLCICYFVFHRKLPVRSIWLDILAVICLLINVYSIFIFLNYTIFDFGYSTITPLSML